MLMNVYLMLKRLIRENCLTDIIADLKAVEVSLNSKGGLHFVNAPYKIGDHLQLKTDTLIALSF